MMLTFSKLFKEINQPYIPRKCLRCQDFLPTKKFKGIRDFFKHYDGQKKKILLQKSQLPLVGMAIY